MKTIEVTVTTPGEVHIIDADLLPGMRLHLTTVPVQNARHQADANHPLWGAPLVYIDPTERLPEEDWGNLI